MIQVVIVAVVVLRRGRTAKSNKQASVVPSETRTKRTSQSSMDTGDDHNNDNTRANTENDDTEYSSVQVQREQQYAF